MTFKESVKKANEKFGAHHWGWNAYPSSDVENANWISVEVCIREEETISDRYSDFGRRISVFKVNNNEEPQEVIEKAVVYLLETFWLSD